MQAVAAEALLVALQELPVLEVVALAEQRLLVEMLAETEPQTRAAAQAAALGVQAQQQQPPLAELEVLAL
jgi:hypothetical protein